MRPFALALALLLPFQSCDVTGAGQDQARARVETGLHPYFPKARVEIDRDRQALVAYTCATNLGEAAIRQVPNILDKNPDFEKLKQVHGALKLKTFELGFDHFVLTLDLETDKYDLLPSEAVPNYTARFAAACGRELV
jgi:hypothetical protein